MIRIGSGHDVHALAKNQSFVLGGVTIDYHLGLVGHSDADALTHSLIDALLGALSLKDIGQYFPNNDKQYRNISSLLLLEKTWSLDAFSLWNINNIDCTIFAQEPKLNSYFAKIKQNYSQVLNCNENQIALKAKTCESLGFIGRKEGVYAHSMVCLTKGK